MRIATPEEIKQHDEEYRIRKQYWHVLVFVDQMNCSEATEYMHRDEMETIYARLKEYDVSSTCDIPNHVCRCSGAGIIAKIRSQA